MIVNCQCPFCGSTESVPLVAEADAAGTITRLIWARCKTCAIDYRVETDEPLGITVDISSERRSALAYLAR